MADRVVRWVCVGLLLGLAPLAVAYTARWYYSERPPDVSELLGTGDALLVVVAWCASALLELLAAPRRGPVTSLVATVTVGVLLPAAVAYGCLTADSVTGRVQTAAQERFLTSASLLALASAATLSTLATVMSGPRKEEP